MFSRSYLAISFVLFKQISFKFLNINRMIIAPNLCIKKYRSPCLFTRKQRFISIAGQAVKKKAVILSMCASWSCTKFCTVRMRNAKLRNHINWFDCLIWCSIDNIRIPWRPWNESLLNMNARLMQGTSLEITKKHMKIATGLPKNLKR